MLGDNISTIQEAIDFLKRLKMIEGSDTKGNPNPSSNNLNPMPNGGPERGQRNDKYRPDLQIWDKCARTTELTTEGTIMTEEVGITDGTTLLETGEDQAIIIPLPDWL